MATKEYTLYEIEKDNYIEISNKKDITIIVYSIKEHIVISDDVTDYIIKNTTNTTKLVVKNTKSKSYVYKLGKHMMHLIRLYMMCLDLLEKEEIITYREDEHDLLMDIRNNKYLDNNGHPISEFFDILNEYEKRFEYAKANTSLPDSPDYKEIETLKYDIFSSIIKESNLL